MRYFCLRFRFFAAQFFRFLKEPYLSPYLFTIIGLDLRSFVQAAFSYKSVFHSLSLLTVCLFNFWTKEY